MGINTKLDFRKFAPPQKNRFSRSITTGQNSTQVIFHQKGFPKTKPLSVGGAAICSTGVYVCPGLNEERSLGPKLEFYLSN